MDIYASTSLLLCSCLWS